MEFIEAEEAARRLCLKIGTLYNWINQGREVGAKFKKMGRKVVILESDLNEYMQGLKSAKKA